jgi:hypothetical protein
VATKGSDSVVLVEAEDPKELVCVSLRGDTQRSRPASAGEDRSDISCEEGREQIVLIEGRVLDRGRCSESVQGIARVCGQSSQRLSQSLIYRTLEDRAEHCSSRHSGGVVNLDHHHDQVCFGD